MTSVMERTTTGTARPEAPQTDVSASTRFLCSAPYLRRSMIPREITDKPRRFGERKKAELVVGKRFCRLALSDDALLDQMTAVDVAQVVRHAHIGRRQACIRDIALCGLLLCCAVLAPFGTVVWLLLGTSPVTLPWLWKRSRGHRQRHRRHLVGLLVLCAVAVVGAIANGGGETRSLLTPLVALACCLVVYFTDAVVSWFQIRRVPRSLGRAPANRLRRRLLRSGLAAAKCASQENVVVYERARIVGVGDDRGKHTLTVPIDEPEKGKAVQRFSAPDLTHFMARHVRAQGIADPNSHALPDLHVDEVVARPLDLACDDSRQIDSMGLRGMLMKPPSGSAARVYVRAQATSWGGEVVGTIFVSVALEGRFLRLVVLPYVLGPIAPELRVADTIRQRDLPTHLVLSSALAVREFWLAIRGAHACMAKLAARLKHEKPQPEPMFAFDDDPSEKVTLRERYSVDTKNDLHQAEDGVRIIQVMEQRVFAVTETFLKEHGIATHQFERQVGQVLNSYVIIGSNNNVAAAANSQAGNGNTMTAQQSSGAN